ncbi:MAG TPA: V-type ATP synthase subunit I [Erysipelothrix sp.]|nr:V-type ATP synthase subunit I [Erysipelothrix sp.]
MAIVKMSEFNLLVQNEDLDAVLREFQIFKDVQFKDINELVSAENGFQRYQSSFDFEDNDEKREHIISILKFIDQFGQEKKGFLEDLNLLDISFEELEQRAQAVDLDEILDRYAEYYERHQVIEGYESVVPWENDRLTTEQLEVLSNSKVILGTVEKAEQAAFLKDLKAVHQAYFLYKDWDEQEVLFMVLFPENEAESFDIIVEKFDFKRRSARSLGVSDDVKGMMFHLNDYLDKRKNIKSRLFQIVGSKEELKIVYEYLTNIKLREETKLKFIQSKQVTMLSGWIVSANKEVVMEEISKVTNGNHYLEIDHAPFHSREVPILLKNNKFNEAFEMITTMYSRPRYDELDPTPLLAPFYGLFYGMMLADIGYGLVMFVVMSLLLKVTNMKPSLKGMVRFLRYLSIPVMIWGAIYGSFFGGLIELPALLDIHNQFTFVLILALGIGVIHIFFGMAIKGYIYVRDYKKRYVLYDVIFWYVLLLATIVLATQIFTDVLAPLSQPAWIAFIIAAVGIVLTNGRSAKSVPTKMASGLYSLYGITNYLSDIISYSRLMALGLAGASIGVAFNMMIDMVSGMGIFSLLLGSLIFIIGHGFNLVINGLSAYVHSARLTYVEFFGKFYSGGGKAFRNFRAAPTYVNVR